MWSGVSVRHLKKSSSHSNFNLADANEAMKKHSVPKQQGLARPYNVYNIFFILERALISQAHSVHQNPHGETPTHQQLSSSIDFCGYDGLCLPDFPPRYTGLLLPLDWYVPGKNAKRKHVATNGSEFNKRHCL